MLGLIWALLLTAAIFQCQMQGCGHVVEWEASDSAAGLGAMKWDHVLREHTTREVRLSCPMEGCNHVAELRFGQVWEGICQHLRVSGFGLCAHDGLIISYVLQDDHGQQKARVRDIDKIAEDYYDIRRELIADRAIVSLMYMCFP